MNAKSSQKEVVNSCMTVAATRQFGSLEIQVYENPEVGHKRVQDDFWMTREQIGTALEYRNASDAIALIHKRNADRLDKMSTTFKLKGVEGGITKEREIICYTLKGVMEICRLSRQPKADSFMDLCWDVMSALMRGETVSLDSRRQAEERAVAARRQANFDALNTNIRELGENQQLLYVQYEELSKSRAADRQAIENVLSYDRAIIDYVKRIVDKVDAALKGIQRMNPSDPNTTPVKFTKYQAPASETSWNHDTKLMIKTIAKAKNTEPGRVRGWVHNDLKTIYGWSVYDERKKYAKEHDIDDVQSIPLWAVVENDPVIRSVFYNKVAERFEECTGRKVARMEEVKKNPPLIPLDKIPERHPVEEPEVVIEAHAVEIETPAVEKAAVSDPKKKKYYYKPSITLPIVEPIANKLGDKTIGRWRTYAKIYDVIGVTKMERMRKEYIRAHHKLPKSTPDIFQHSDKNLKVFKEAARILDSIS